MTPETVVRPLERAEIEPHIALLESEGFTPDVDRGQWLGVLVGPVLAGWIRIFREGGSWMIEDVYVLQEHRSAGLASRLLREAQTGRDELWLICDDEMVEFYRARGYELTPKGSFPETLATLYRARSEWPDGGDHNHNAMRWSRA